ncbi:MAG: MotA/TolQ/ExbB proton channel family protein [Ignavibacteriae bacterium]|nr:MotA/TolQ/ExbB proton channel family protein [Ignavibacteriota bacterium]
MKKSGVFTTVLIIVAFVVALLVFILVLGNPANFKTPEKTIPTNLLGAVYLGGYIVPLLITLSIMVITYTIERALSLSKAKGKGKIEDFLKKIQISLKEGNTDEAIGLCDKQKGSIANIIRQGLEKYQETASIKEMDAERKLEEVKNAIEEAMGLELPLLNTNLPALATIASVSVLVGLFGTVVGMIKSFQALATAGTPNAAELSAGISEALINTAGGLFGAIVGTISYNFFLTKVGSITYMIDEATYNILSIIAYKSK